MVEHSGAGNQSSYEPAGISFRCDRSRYFEHQHIHVVIRADSVSTHNATLKMIRIFLQTVALYRIFTVSFLQKVQINLCSTKICKFYIDKIFFSIIVVLNIKTDFLKLLFPIIKNVFTVSSCQKNIYVQTLFSQVDTFRVSKCDSNN